MLTLLPRSEVHEILVKEQNPNKSATGEKWLSLLVKVEKSVDVQ